MHFGDYTFILVLALILFGPRKLPELGRQAGRLMMEFRRASNEFKMQMEDELRNLEEEDRQKKLEAAAADTGTIAQPQGLPSETGQAETFSEAEADDELHKPQPYSPPLPHEEYIDPVDLLDAPQCHPEDLYEEDSGHGEDRYSAYRGYDESESEEHGPEIFAESEEHGPGISAESAASYQPSDEPHSPAQADSEEPHRQSPEKPQDPVRPESDPAIRHA